MSINSYLYQTFSLLRIWWRKLKHIKVDFTKWPDPSWFRYNLSNPSYWNNCTVNPLLRLWVPLKVLVTILQARLLSPFRLLLVYFINVSFQCTFHKCLSQHLPPQVFSCSFPLSLLHMPNFTPCLHPQTEAPPPHLPARSFISFEPLLGQSLVALQHALLCVTWVLSTKANSAPCSWLPALEADWL